MQTKEEKLAKAREYKLKHKDKIKADNKAWYERNKPPPALRLDEDMLYKRERSRQAGGRAVRKGMVYKVPCVVCGESKVEAHHVDYDKPLDIIWLCSKHHRLLHAEHRVYD